MTYELMIPGEPTAKQRPRHGKGYTYTPEKTVNYENLVKMCFMEQGYRQLLEGPIEAHITAYFGIPKSTSKKKHEKMMLGDIVPTKKPDTDNIAKIVLDALNGIAYKDDSQVARLEVIKFYDEVPRVEVRLKSINDFELPWENRRDRV
jgi:Holliday junction resolvase RusA-like endonuclease